MRPAPSPGLCRLVATNAPLWAGEAAVFAAYWDASTRTRATDRLWVARQCHKELCDGVLPRVHALETAARSLAADTDQGALATLAAGIQTELAHFRAFTGLYDRLRDATDPALDAALIERVGWPENRELARIRARHRDEHGVLGRRAADFTEGGYCTLYTAGRALAGRGGIDDAIAAACAGIVDDEWEHMLAGISHLDDTTTCDEDWQLLAALTAEQGRARIRMRNAQFGGPLDARRLRDAEMGACPPLPFDFARAGFVAP